MKTAVRSILIVLLLAAAVTNVAGMPNEGRREGMAPMQVTVTDSTGKTVYRGVTNVNGMFATGALQPGEYVVQFSSRALKGGPYALLVYAGKQKFGADSVPGEKLAKGGVAMRVKVEGNKGANIAGNYSHAEMDRAAATGTFKMINGKRYVWVGPETGSNIGGRWVEESSAAQGLNVSKMSGAGHQNILDRGNIPERDGGNP